MKHAFLSHFQVKGERIILGTHFLENDKMQAYSFEGEVTLGDHLSDLSDDLTLGVGQIDSLHSDVELTGLTVLPGFFRLHKKIIFNIKVNKSHIEAPIVSERRCYTFCKASSSSLRLFSSCLAAAGPPPAFCSSSRRLVATLAFSYSSCRWVCSSRAFLRALSASC